MELADWLELGTLLVTLAALGATVWIATRSLRQQAAEAQASLGHHTREALLDRVWERRADLYLDLLDWLADKDDSAFDVSMDAHQEATDSELELLIQQFEDAVEGRQARDVPRPEPVAAAITALVHHLEPPRRLKLRMELFASAAVLAELETYTTTVIAPFATDAALPALELLTVNDRVAALRAAVVEEIGARGLEQRAA